MGVHDYPLCQSGEWTHNAAASLYLLDGGVVDGTTWEADPQLLTVPQHPVTIVGRGTAAWNPELYVLHSTAICSAGYSCRDDMYGRIHTYHTSET